MEYKRYGNKIIARLDKNEEVVTTLTELCARESVCLASVNAIGAVSKATIGNYNTVEKKYYSKEVTGIFEIASLSGTVSTMDGKTYLHLHCVLADETYQTVGGHLNSAIVSATCEIVIDVIDGQVNRQFSEEIGLNLFKF